MLGAAQLSYDLEDTLHTVKGSVVEKVSDWCEMGWPSLRLLELKMDLVMNGDPAQITGIPLS